MAENELKPCPFCGGKADVILTGSIEKEIQKLNDEISVLKENQKSNIKNIEAKYKFGLGDAAVTGIYSGVVYAVVNGFAAYIRNYYKIKNQKLEVIPDFDNVVQEFNAKIEVVIRAAFFLPTLLRLIKIFKGKEEV